MSNNRLTLKNVEKNRRIGENIEVSCIDEDKLITNDIWDDNSTDNMLHFRCGYNLKYDAPNGIPTCVAKCEGNLLVNYPENEVGRNPIREQESRPEIFENDKLW